MSSKQTVQPHPHFNDPKHAYNGNAGILSNELTQISTENSQVWQSDNSGTNWTYLGNGSIV